MSFSGLLWHRWPVALFCLLVRQYLSLHSWLTPLGSARQVLQHLFRSQIDFLFEVLCCSRNMFRSWNVYYTLHRVIWRLSKHMEVSPCSRYTSAHSVVCHHSRLNFYMHYMVLFRHRARYIHDHVIVLFDIIVEQINFLGGVDLPFENYVFTCQALINCYLLLPKIFLEFD